MRNKINQETVGTIRPTFDNAVGVICGTLHTDITHDSRGADAWIQQVKLNVHSSNPSRIVFIMSSAWLPR